MTMTGKTRYKVCLPYFIIRFYYRSDELIGKF
jgi:hypothetical protein